MKKAYQGVSDFNPEEFDNWLETTTIKMFKHAKVNRNKFGSYSESDRTSRKKKREGKSHSSYL